MNLLNSIYHTVQRSRTLQTHRISALPVVILMPHSACNCRCIMCDIWKDNKNLKQLTEKDIQSLLIPMKKWGTQQVLMSGGEALLHPLFFDFCKLLNRQGIKVTLLSTGLTLKKYADQILNHVSSIIVSLDGDEATHNSIRNIPDAYQKLQEGVLAIKALNPKYRITARTVIHRLNFKVWDSIIDTAKSMQLDQISFLPADISSHAFNREVLWSDQRQHEVLPAEDELPLLKEKLEKVIENYHSDFVSGFIAEKPGKLRNIHTYYAAHYNQQLFPAKKCNAPWVSAVIEADGNVRPCFFHAAVGNIHEHSIEEILNSEASIRFRKNLDINTDSTCVKCVCSLHLSPGNKLT